MMRRFHLFSRCQKCEMIYTALCIHTLYWNHLLIIYVYIYQKERHTETPDALNGRLTAKPSGKFWIPIPIAKFLALSNVAEADLPTAPNPTPTAKP